MIKSKSLVLKKLQDGRSQIQKYEYLLQYRFIRGYIFFQSCSQLFLRKDGVDPSQYLRFNGYQSNAKVELVAWFLLVSG